jgi:hypothetical protein
MEAYYAEEAFASVLQKNDSKPSTCQVGQLLPRCFDKANEILFHLGTIYKPQLKVHDSWQYASFAGRPPHGIPNCFEVTCDHDACLCAALAFGGRSAERWLAGVAIWRACTWKADPRQDELV